MEFRIGIFVFCQPNPNGIAQKRPISSLIDRFQLNVFLVRYDTGTDPKATRKKKGVGFFRAKCCHGPPKINHQLLFFHILQVHKCIYVYCAMTFTTQKSISGAVVSMIVWQLDFQLPMQSVSITTDVVSSNLDQGEVYNIM